MTEAATIHHFDTLLPETVLESVTAQGLRPTGSLLPLNSYENRVYEIELEKNSFDGRINERDNPLFLTKPDSLVIKFYRPNRWSFECIFCKFLHW